MFIYLNMYVYPNSFLPSCWYSLCYFYGTAAITIAPAQVDGLMQKRYNYIANTLELRLFCIEPSK